MTRRIEFDLEHTVLLVVDMQPDFMLGGPLAVEGGYELAAPIAGLMRSGRFAHCVATQDWHPRGHASFASTHPGRQPFDCVEHNGHEQTLWPDHCVQGSDGAALHDDLPQAHIDMIQRKGMNPQVDSYSGFRENWDAEGRRAATGLCGWLREREVSDVFVCGLARDVCVKWTAEDAADAGFNTWFLWDLTRPVDSATDEAVRTDLQARDVKIINAVELAG